MNLGINFNAEIGKILIFENEFKKNLFTILQGIIVCHGSTLCWNGFMGLPGCYANETLYDATEGHTHDNLPIQLIVPYNPNSVQGTTQPEVI